MSGSSFGKNRELVVDLRRRSGWPQKPRAWPAVKTVIWALVVGLASVGFVLWVILRG